VRAAMLKLEPQPPPDIAQIPQLASQAGPIVVPPPPLGQPAETETPELDLSGIWYRRKTGADGPLSTQRVRISARGDRLTVKIIADCDDGCLPGSASWKAYRHDPDNPVPDYAGQYVVDGQTMASGPLQWILPSGDGDCRITSRRIGDISPDGNEIVIRTSDSGSNCRMFESDVRLWRPGA
jgi:hypothetical protein